MRRLLDRLAYILGIWCAGYRREYVRREWPALARELHL